MELVASVAQGDIPTDVLVAELSRLLDEPQSGRLRPDTPLSSFANWDSLTKVSLVGCIVDMYGITLDGTALDGVETVNDIARLISMTPGTTVP